MSSSWPTATTQELEALVAKYTADFPVHRPTVPAPSSEVALVTGTTGGLGSALLAHLVMLPTVSRIYAFNRKDVKGRPLKQRQAEALTVRGLDGSVVDSPKVVLIEGNGAAPDLGISESLFAEMRDSVTFIIHNAWRMNFMQDVYAFESLISSVRILADFALASPHPCPPRFIFTSTAAAFWNWPLLTPVPEEPIEDPSVAVHTGYGSSKWISERILQIASQKTPLRTLSVRIGQLSPSGDGFWEADSWLPIQIASSQYLGVTPSGYTKLPVIPIETAAAALVEMRNSPYAIHHIHHPRPLDHGVFARIVSESIGARVVSYAEWVRHLEASGRSPNAKRDRQYNPAYRMVKFFASMTEKVSAPGRDEIGMPVFEMRKAMEVASVLGEDVLPTTSEEDIVGWLRAWKRDGRLPLSSVPRRGAQSARGAAAKL
ncbi:hypothetical protein BOTBODRAFT_145241 [Botryobasidium botryosum FD-172 SS1]|uniref:Thioester reductase (TE) domain-containing protein n=1 Tax=Botryobasidium botryosum (strain FD-172 SS1) TaxID=930990 RepID=A0A067MKE3_BOTB1|nr:hypothetical protein BOTBODRAFT_145241 [Botryobasidium botryosum FD-172 SS1]